MIQELPTYKEMQEAKRLREEIFCEMCQKFHRWKKAAGEEYKPVEQNDRER